jgi:DNA-binding GntR family transcriptional regulator
VLSSYTKNKALQALLSDLVATSGPETLAIYSLPDASERSLSQHQEIVDALGQADIKRVSDVARMHLIDAAQKYLSSFDEPAPSVPR